MTNNDPTPSDVVANRVRAIRDQRGWTAQQLAARCAQIGAPRLTALVIANIETGRRDAQGRRRRNVTVDELVALARALDVPPVLLLYPVGMVEEVEVLPGRTMPTWNAAKWFTGEEPLCERAPDGTWFVSPDDDQAWQTGAAPVDLHREHDRLISEWKAARNQEGSSRVKASSAAPGDEQRAVYLQQAREHGERAGQVEEQLKWVRSHMRRFGLTPPALTGDLADMDERAGSGRG